MDHFTDYETVFRNFSVPVSCCNTTNPLANECPDIVRNSQQMINQTGLIYPEVNACMQCAVHVVTNSVTIGLCVSFGVILQRHVHFYCCSHYYYCKSAGIYCLIITHCITFDIYLSSQLAAVLMVWCWCSIVFIKMLKNN